MCGVQASSGSRHSFLLFRTLRSQCSSPRPCLLRASRGFPRGPVTDDPHLDSESSKVCFRRPATGRRAGPWAGLTAPAARSSHSPHPCSAPRVLPGHIGRSTHYLGTSGDHCSFHQKKPKELRHIPQAHIRIIIIFTGCFY